MPTQSSGRASAAASWATSGMATAWSETWTCRHPVGRWAVIVPGRPQTTPATLRSGRCVKISGGQRATPRAARTSATTAFRCCRPPGAAGARAPMPPGSAPRATRAWRWPAQRNSSAHSRASRFVPAASGEARARMCNGTAASTSLQQLLGQQPAHHARRRAPANRRRTGRQRPHDTASAKRLAACAIACSASALRSRLARRAGRQAASTGHGRRPTLQASGPRDVDDGPATSRAILRPTMPAWLRRDAHRWPPQAASVQLLPQGEPGRGQARAARAARTRRRHATPATRARHLSMKPDSASASLIASAARRTRRAGRAARRPAHRRPIPPDHHRSGR